MPSSIFPELPWLARLNLYGMLTACVTEVPESSNLGSPRSSSASDSTLSSRTSPPNSPARAACSSPPQAHSERSALFTRPAWLSAAWLAATGASAPSETTRIAQAKQNQERHDRCSLHFSRTAASKKIIDDIANTVEQALSKAYGTAVPAQFARELEAMKKASKQCDDALVSLAPFGNAPLDASCMPRQVTSADLDDAQDCARRATKAAVDCSERLSALTEITDANSPVTIDGPLQQHGGSPLNGSHIDKALRIVASDEFQHRLTSGLTFQQNLQRGLHQAGTVLQHAASDAVEWLLPTLKTKNPAAHAHQLVTLKSIAHKTASVDQVAQARFAEVKHCLGQALLHASKLIEVKSATELVAYMRRVPDMLKQSKLLSRQISDAAKVTSRLESHNASGWLTVSHAEHDIAAATLQLANAEAALMKLSELRDKAKRLPNESAPERR